MVGLRVCCWGGFTFQGKLRAGLNMDGGSWAGEMSYTRCGGLKWLDELFRSDGFGGISVGWIDEMGVVMGVKSCSIGFGFEG